MKMPVIKQEYFTLAGGLDIVAPLISTAPGTCKVAQNFEQALRGGYSRVGGYERFDGRPAPSAATVTRLPVVFSDTVALGDTVTGVTSTETGVVIALETDAILVTKVSGDFDAAEVLNVGGAPVATMNGIPAASAMGAPSLAQEYQALAANVYRADIGVVPGSGSILGVCAYNGSVYAFRNNAGGTAAVMHKATTSGWTAVTHASLLPGGRFEFAIYNFGTGLKMYGCDGKNKAFMFDGTTFTQITTGMTTDVPNHIAAHANYLFLSFGHSVQFSALGDPTSWTPVLGAGEINIGDTVTAFVTQPGNAGGWALSIFSRNGSFVLYGSGTDWQLVTMNNEAGAYPYTAQAIGATYALDDRGVISSAATQNYGNFESANISARINPWLLRYRSTAVGAMINREKSQYRLFFGGGFALYLTIVENQPAGFMTMAFSHSFNVVYSSEVITGVEESYAGGTNGYVYMLDKGNSFDGESIYAYIGLQFNPVRSVRVLKQFRKAVVETSGEGYLSLYIGSELGYGSVEIQPNTESMLTPDQTHDSVFENGYWDSGYWDEGIWDGQGLIPIEHDLTGSAENVSMLFGQRSYSQPPITLHGVVLQYSPRRVLR